jgi:PAS domain S-box-containing protein
MVPPPPPDDFRDLVEQAFTGLFILTDDRIAYANHAFRQLIGYDPEALARIQAWDIIHPEERDRVRAMAEARLARQRPSEVYETRFVRQDGVEVRVEVRASPIAFRGLPAVLVHALDITDRKRAEQALSLSETRLRTFIEHAPMGIYRMSPAGELGLANQAFRTMLGFGPGHAWPARGLDRESFDPAFPRSELRRGLERDGQARGVESAWIRRDNALLYVRESARVVRDEAGAVLYVEGTVEDVTVQKQTAQRLQFYAQRLQVKHEIDRAMLEARGEDELALAVATRLHRLLPCQRASVILFDPERDQARVAAAVQGPDFAAGPTAGVRVPLEALTPAAELGQTPFVYLTDLTQVESPPALIRELGAQGVRSVLSLPLWAGKELIGQLNLASREPAAFDSEHKQLALEVCRQLSTALHQARLRAALEAEGVRLLTLLDNLPAGVLWLDGHGQRAVSNRLAEEFLKLPGAPREAELAELSGEQGAALELRLNGPPLRLFELVSRPVPPPGSRAGLLVLLREVTAERLLQRQVRQQERLAAIGELARGVAHDFNNLLSAIQGLTQLARRRAGLAPPDPALADIEQMCERGASLTRQLLAFGRRQELQTRPLDLRHTVENLAQMLRRLLGKDIELVLRPSPRPVRVLADPAQMEQVVVNLVVNARDAMPRGGLVTVEIEPFELAPEDITRLPWTLPPGRYARLSVRDTGQGMDEGTLARVFEPFFTTKAERGGTGLGLSTVLGIVRQAGGEIRADSAPGQGTCFELLLPGGQA